MTGRVTRIESEANGDNAVYLITVERHPVSHYAMAPEYRDLPDDIRRTLTAWLAGKQP